MYTCTTFSSSIHSSMDIQVTSTTWLLYANYLCNILFSIMLVIYLEVILLDYHIFNSEECSSFLNGYCIVSTTPAQVSSPLYPCQCLQFCALFIQSDGHCNECKVMFNYVSICTSWMINDYLNVPIDYSHVIVDRKYLLKLCFCD